MKARENSFRHIVHSYFAAVTKRAFSYDGVVVEPKRLVVSPLLFRGFTCHPGCGACCHRYTLEYLPTEVRPAAAYHCTETINTVTRVVYRVPQDTREVFCGFLRLDDGSCSIHNEKPFHCDFELLRPLIGKDRVKWIQKLPGRHWCMQRVPGRGKGAMCEITAPSADTTREVIRKLKRLKEWTDYFELETWLPDIIAWAAQGPHNKSLVLVTGDAIKDSLEITHESLPVHHQYSSDLFDKSFQADIALD